MVMGTTQVNASHAMLFEILIILVSQGRRMQTHPIETLDFKMEQAVPSLFS